MFPPTQNLLAILEDSTRRSLGPDQQKLIESTIAAWNATLFSIDSSLLRDKEARFTGESKGAAALAILATIFDFFIIPLVFLLDKLPYFLSFGTLALTIGSLALALLTMLDGVHGVVGMGEHELLGIRILCVGVALKFAIIVVAACCRVCQSTPESGDRPLRPQGRSDDNHDSLSDDLERASTSDSNHIPLRPQEWLDDDLSDGLERAERNRKVGYQGEKHVSIGAWCLHA